MAPALRVLHIASGDLWAGAEAQACTLISHLAQMPDVETAVVLMNDGMLADKLRRVGVTLYVSDERKVSSVRIFSELRRILNAWQPDVIHTHREKENILGSLANRFCRNVPSVRTVHGGEEHSAGEGWRGVRHRAVSGVDRWCGRALQQRIIAVTNELGTRLSHEFPIGKIEVIENGVDFEAVRATRRAAEFRSAAPECAHIGIVGRLVAVKRVDLFIEMAARLLREQPGYSWRFHVFGEGPKRPELESASAAAGIAASIQFHGHRADIETCIAGLDALVICSDHEGMPMTALEAAALEIPTVAHAVGGLTDIVPEELLVHRHDAQGYSEGVVRVLREDGSAIARRHAREVLPRFSATRNAARIATLYRRVIAECRGDPGATKTSLRNGA